MDLPAFLNREATGDICLAGSRIGLFHVVQYYNDGYSAEMLICHYPTLSLSLIHKVIGFYLDNQADVDAYVADCQESLQQHRATNPQSLARSA